MSLLCIYHTYVGSAVFDVVERTSYCSSTSSTIAIKKLHSRRELEIK